MRLGGCSGRRVSCWWTGHENDGASTRLGGRLSMSYSLAGRTGQWITWCVTAS